LKDGSLEISYLKMCNDEIDADFGDILEVDTIKMAVTPQFNIRQRISKSDYLLKVGAMRDHIQRGDIYEANFCMEFYAENAEIEPFEIYQKLNSISKPPFAAFFRNNNGYILSASPERYLKKSGNKLISQPIKGTARRSIDPIEDQTIKLQLVASEKERAENIMIVDLVRNDLSKTAARGSVEVEELCGVNTFRQVHHLVSTVVSELATGFSSVDAIRTTFPMGSMTGAPKISAMNIIEKLEETKRGVYSGSVGYFTPEGDFDFNVIIRSILYNKQQKYVSFSVGSAITSEASAEAEYEECMLKARAMLEVLS
jgi:para-aminobenzoate synthetase component 1